VVPEAVEAYQTGDRMEINMQEGVVYLGNRQFKFSPLPGKLMKILEMGGLVNWIRKQ
jgi:hypothetical protein